mgnify:CR=1 FL=1
MWGSKNLVEVTTSSGAIVTASRESLSISEPAVTLPWYSVVSAVWEAPVLKVLATYDGKPLKLDLEIPNPKRLPEVVRERVTDSVIITERRTLPAGVGATFVARRHPGDEVAWAVVFDSGVDSADPALQEQASELLSELRSTLGI